MSKILIEVRGGCVQAVFSSSQQDEVEIWDWDNIETVVEDIGKLEGELEEIVKGLYTIY